MIIYRAKRQCLVFLATIALAGSGFAADQSSTANNTWGKTDFPGLEWQTDGTRKIATAWRKKDGAHALISQIPIDHRWSQVYETDTKGVVVSGSVLISETQLTSGSYWARPGGGQEDLTCTGATQCIVYLESEPTVGAVSPTIVSANDIPWLEVPNTYGNVFLAWVWGKPDNAEPSSFFLKFKAGFPGAPHTHTESYEGIVIQGQYKHWEVGDSEMPVMPVGTPFWQAGGAPHDDSCASGRDCISYFRIDGGFDYFPHNASSKH